MKTETQKDFSNFFDRGPDEPEISCNECECCFFRLSTIERFTNDVQQLREGRK
jgi:hypothetical protein